VEIEVGVSGLTRPPVDALVPMAKTLEAQGFEAMWFADHFLHWYPPSAWSTDLFPQAATEPSPHTFLDPGPLMGAVVTHTERMIVATGVTDAIRRHPAVIAQTFATLNHMSHGRVRLGLGVGEAENIIPFGMPYERTASRLIEALEVIRLLWSTTDPVDFDGEFVQLHDAVIGLGPYAGKDPEIWVPAHRPRVLKAVARLADGWLPIILDPLEYAARLADIRSASLAAGRAVDAVRPGLYVWIVCDEDRDVAERLLGSLALRLIALTAPAEMFEAAGVEHPLATRWGLLDYVPTQLTRKDALAAAYAVPDEVLRTYYTWGTPDDIVGRLTPFLHAGCEVFDLTSIGPAGDPALAPLAGPRNLDIAVGLRAAAAAVTPTFPA
jgi:phthiodiolone/phenolphthiodiolone dimycocerosates ketoreductase